MSCVYLCIIVIVKRDKNIAKKYFIYFIFFERGVPRYLLRRRARWRLRQDPESRFK